MWAMKVLGISPWCTPSLSPQPASGTPKSLGSTQNDHISHRRAASSLALSNTWANSLCHFWKAAPGTRNTRQKNTAALLCRPNPPMKCHFPDFFLLLLNKSISIIKVPSLFLLCVTIFFFLEKNTHLKSVGLGQGLRIIQRKHWYWSCTSSVFFNSKICSIPLLLKVTLPGCGNDKSRGNPIGAGIALRPCKAITPEQLQNVATFCFPALHLSWKSSQLSSVQLTLDLN